MFSAPHFDSLLLNWKNLKTRRQTLKAEIVHKSINGLAPEYLTRKFIQRSDVNPDNLREFENKLAIALPTYKLS